MITADESVFPNNVVELVALRAQLLDSDLYVTKRPIRNSDPTQSVGVFAATWTPDEESHEFHGQPSHEPTLQSYIVLVQSFVKDMDEERGLATHSTLSSMIRVMLYRDEPLRVGLSALQSTVLGTKERIMRWGPRTVRYVSNEVEGKWLYLSVLEFLVETETV